MYFCKVTIVVLDPFEEIFILICLVMALHLIYVSKVKVKVYFANMYL